ncbi:MAG TPA: carboxypeptidase-like regulatory domain-containing protein, partial [Ignavibacteria bacterium]|nr:carboxypeptidase-like regulatory domain-containing protein [Ignavibacteria bacterium]
MKNKTYILFQFLLLFVLLPSLLRAQATGSISGTISDDNGEPLTGAIVKIQGSQNATASDDNGEFLLQNLDAGTYNLITTFIGFDSLITQNVRVTANQITKLKLVMVPEGIEIGPINVTAERDIRDVNQTGITYSSEQIEHKGVHGLQNIIANSISTVQDERGGAVNIRGGRTNETVYYVDGNPTTNLLDGSTRASVPNSLINEIAVITGGVSAEYGNLTTVVNVTTKSGTDYYTGSVEAITDELITKIGNTRKQGYNLYNVTFGGPVIPSQGLSKVLNFYGSFERAFNRINGPSWAFNNLPKLFPGGEVHNDEFSSYSYNGRLNVNLKEIKDSGIPINFRFGASIVNSTQRVFSTSNVIALDPITGALTTNSHRNGVQDNNDYQFYGRMSHEITENFFYEIQASYFKYYNEEYDPLFGDNVYLYGDTNYNPAATVQGSFGGLDPNLASLFATYGTVRNLYQKLDISYIGGKIDATWTKLTKDYGDHEVKFGMEYKYNTLRKMTVFPSPLADLTVDAKDRWYGTNQGSLSSYGYEIVDAPSGTLITTGTQSDGTQEKHPLTGGFYIRDKVSFSDFNFNGGFRVDFLDVNDEVLRDISYDVVGPDGIIASDDDFVQSKPTIEVSPRLGFSFPVTDKTIFIAQYGKMIQMPQLNLLYVSKETLRRFLSTSLQDVVENSSLQPTKVIQYEIGLRHLAGDYIDMGITAFYKESTDLIGAGRVEGPANRIPNGFATYLNNDFAIARGMDFYLSMRRYNRLAVDLAYTLAFSSGTGSDFNSKFLLANNLDPTTGQTLPRFVYPLDYDQRHTGSVNLDYRFIGDDAPSGWAGSVLQNFGINLLFTFNSGRPYQRKQPSTSATGTGVGELPLSSKNEVYTDWRYRVDLRIDKTVDIWKTSLNFNIYVINLLNSEIINAVYPSTGTPNDNGFLQTPTGASRYETNAFFREYWQERISVRGNWGPPR